MAINWGKEAGAFADGLVRGSEAISSFDYRTAEAQKAREQADTLRGQNPYKDPQTIRDLNRANGFMPAGKPNSAGLPAMPGGLPRSTGNSVLPTNTIPYDTVFPKKGFAGGGLVPGEPEQFAEQFKELYAAEHPDDGGLADSAQGVIPASTPTRREPMPPAMTPPPSPPPPPSPSAFDRAQARGRGPEPVLNVPQHQSGYAPGSGGMPPINPDAPPPPPREAPAPPTDGVIPGSAAAGLASRPGPRAPAPVPTIPELWPSIRDRLAKVFAPYTPPGTEPTQISDNPGAKGVGEALDSIANQFKGGPPASTAGRPDLGIPPSAAAPGAPVPAPAPGGGPAPPELRPGLEPPAGPAAGVQRGGREGAAPAPAPVPAPAPAAGAPKPGTTGPIAAGPPTGGPGTAPAAAPAPSRKPVASAAPPTPGVVDPLVAPEVSNPASGITMQRGRSTSVVGADDQDVNTQLSAALNGAQRHASREYQLDESGRVLPTSAAGDQQSGRMAVLAGSGAATPQAVATIDRAVQQASGGAPFSEAMRSTMRMLAVYDFYTRSGQTAKADAMAYELMQYSTMVASMHGREALQLARQGNIGGAAQKVADAYNAIPNGKSAAIVDGKAVITDLFTGQQEQTIPLDPRLILTLARGFDDKGATFSMIAARAQRVADKGRKQTPLQEEHMRAQTDYLRARTANVGKGGKAPAALPNSDEVERIRQMYPSGGAPPGATAPQVSQGGGEDERAAENAAADGMATTTAPVDTGAGDEEVAGVGRGGSTPALAQAPTTQTLSGGTAQDTMTGSAGLDTIPETAPQAPPETMSDAAPEPLEDGQQLAQAGPPASAPPPPSAPAVKFDPKSEVYDHKRAHEIEPNARDGKVPIVDPRDGTLLVGHKHPAYDKITDEARVSGVSVVPRADGREVVHDHNRPISKEPWVRKGNDFVEAPQATDVLSPTERATYDDARRTAAHHLARGKAGSTEARYAAGAVKAWDKTIETRQKAAAETTKAETKAAIANKFTTKEAEEFENAVTSAMASPTVAVVVPVLKGAFNDSQILELTKRIAQTNQVSPRAAVEMLGVLARGGGAIARTYQVLGRDITNSGVVVEAPRIPGKTPAETSPGFDGRIFLDDNTFKAINQGAATNTAALLERQRAPTIGQKFKQLFP